MTTKQWFPTLIVCSVLFYISLIAMLVMHVIGITYLYGLTAAIVALLIGQAATLIWIISIAIDAKPKDHGL